MAMIGPRGPLPAVRGITVAMSERQAQIAANAQTLDKQFQGLNKDAPGGDWGGAYIRYMAFHPSSDPDAVFNAVETALAGAEKQLNAVPKGIGEAVGAVGHTVGSTIPVGIAKGADVLGGLNLGSLMVRIGEVLLGIVLIGVGIAKLTGASNVISTAAKVAIK
jgi:hypothetical protein